MPRRGEKGLRPREGTHGAEGDGGGEEGPSGARGGTARPKKQKQQAAMMRQRLKARRAQLQRDGNIMVT